MKKASMAKILLILIVTLMSGCSNHVHTGSHKLCEVSDNTEFGKNMLDKARIISRDPHIKIFGDCREIKQLEAGEILRLTAWQYKLRVNEAKKLELEDFSLNS